MAYESAKSSTKNQATKVGTSAKSAAKLAATSGDTKSGMPTMSGSEVTFQECDAIEEEIAALKVAYEHYFLGTERVPPTRQYEDLKKRVMRLKGSFVRNTSAKFRVQSIHGKFVTYERLWQRTIQEIENGTYKRDVVKARRRIEKKPGDRPRTQGSVELPDDELDSLDGPSLPVRGVPSVAPLVPSVAPLVPSVAPVTPAVKPLVPSVAPVIPAIAPLVPSVKPLVPSVAPVAARPAGAPRAAPPAARPAAASGNNDLSDARLKSVYDAYVAAKRNNKEDTSKMNYDSVAASLRKQVPELMKQHKANSVEFKVVIKDGKAVLKAVPK
ncbi:MXAN_5187 C-terminal domain-containing protein [Cystobacter fuscus]|nr:MXAN_5187 C-terminal domain-containing protein [Cystobacter fuscus]